MSLPSVCRKEAGGLLRIIAAPVIELGSAGLAVPRRRCTSSSEAPLSSAIAIKVARTEWAEMPDPALYGPRMLAKHAADGVGMTSLGNNSANSDAYQVEDDATKYASCCISAGWSVHFKDLCAARPDVNG
jgi:hypothetical protein